MPGEREARDHGEREAPAREVGAARDEEEHGDDGGLGDDADPEHRALVGLGAEVLRDDLHDGGPEHRLGEAVHGADRDHGRDAVHGPGDRRVAARRDEERQEDDLARVEEIREEPRRELAEAVDGEGRHAGEPGGGAGESGRVADGEDGGFVALAGEVAREVDGAAERDEGDAAAGFTLRHDLKCPRRGFARVGSRRGLRRGGVRSAGRRPRSPARRPGCRGAPG